MAGVVFTAYLYTGMFLVGFYLPTALSVANKYNLPKMRILGFFVLNMFSFPLWFILPNKAEDGDSNEGQIQEDAPRRHYP